MRFVLSIVLLALAMVQRGPLVPVGTTAPGFSVTDDRGAMHSLSGFKGKYVVLEWHEKGCPYVAKHYRGGAMQRLQAEWMARGVVWLLVNSSAEGTHSYLAANESRDYFAGLKTAPTAALLDHSGKLGKLYGVTTALHMVIIDPAGTVIYNGAIDDQPKTEASSLNGAKNYVAAALAEALAGKPVTTAATVPYGCEVHYAR
jgi:peroxiredoxin